jgi:hypothetical protein
MPQGVPLSRSIRTLNGFEGEIAMYPGYFLAGAIIRVGLPWLSSWCFCWRSDAV